MADDLFRTEGADALLQLGKRLRAAGMAPTVVKELQKALNARAKEAVPKTRAEALRRLPKTGGTTKRKKDPLNKRVAKAPQRVTSRIGNTTASVRVTVAGKKSGAAQADSGIVRHPVFRLSREQARRLGDPRREMWVEQKVPGGWFTDTMNKEAPKAREDVVAVMTEFAEMLARPLPRR